MTDAVHPTARRRLNRTGGSKTIGGRHAAATDGDGVCAQTSVNPEGGTPLDVFDYTYNSDGELTAVSDDNSAYQYTYNADGEETSQADVGSPDLPTVTLTYDYDADGDRTAMDDSLGGLVSYTYNAAGRADQRDAFRHRHLGHRRGKFVRQRRQYDGPDPVLEPGRDRCRRVHGVHV